MILTLTSTSQGKINSKTRPKTWRRQKTWSDQEQDHPKNCNTSCDLSPHDLGRSNRWWRVHHGFGNIIFGALMCWLFKLSCAENYRPRPRRMRQRVVGSLGFKQTLSLRFLLLLGKKCCCWYQTETETDKLERNIRTVTSNGMNLQVHRHQGSRFFPIMISTIWSCVSSRR